MSETVNVTVAMKRSELLALIENRIADLNEDLENGYGDQTKWLEKAERLVVMLKALPQPSEEDE